MGNKITRVLSWLTKAIKKPNPVRAGPICSLGLGDAIRVPGSADRRVVNSDAAQCHYTTYCHLMVALYNTLLIKLFDKKSTKIAFLFVYYLS